MSKKYKHKRWAIAWISSGGWVEPINLTTSFTKIEAIAKFKNLPFSRNYKLLQQRKELRPVKLFVEVENENA